MNQTLQEFAAGLTQNDILEFLKAKNKNPDNYEIFPFLETPYLKNIYTNKTIKLSRIKNWKNS